jgi:PilZ domain
VKPPGKERRRFPRHVGSLPIEIREVSRSYPMQCETTDISVGGCYVKTMFTLAVGAKVNVRIRLPEQEFHLQGVIRTADPGLGNGIEFGEMTAQQREELARYLDKIVARNAEPAPIIR